MHCFGEILCKMGVNATKCRSIFNSYYAEDNLGQSRAKIGPLHPFLFALTVHFKGLYTAQQNHMK